MHVFMYAAVGYSACMFGCACMCVCVCEEKEREHSGILTSDLVAKLLDSSDYLRQRRDPPPAESTD